METPEPVDIHVGAKVKQRRLMLGMSQDKLARELGLTFQQVQKYERGTNRIGASRLHAISRILSVPESFFFADMPVAPGFAEPSQEPFANNPMERKETLDLVRAYYRISDTTVRKRILDMVKAMANATASEDNTG